MQPSSLHYFPLTWPFLALLLILLALLVGLIQFGIIAYAYDRIGIRRSHVFLLLLLSFLGAYINIPVAHLPQRVVVTEHVVNFFGMQYVVPEVEQWPGTIIAVNVGGALIPTLVSIYLLLRNRLILSGLVGVVAVTLLVHWLAYPVKGVGIATPGIAPPLFAAIVAMILSRGHAAALAYASGCLGTLIGADLLNLDKIQGLGAPIASIGGAGTFDGVFLTGIVAVLLTWDFGSRGRDVRKQTRDGVPEAQPLAPGQEHSAHPTQTGPHTGQTESPASPPSEHR